MRGLKKPLGTILLLAVMSMGGASVFADGVSQLPTRTITQDSSDTVSPTNEQSGTSTFVEIVNYMVQILPL